MPTYFFDVQSRSGLVCLDYQGLDCPDDDAALTLARHGAGFTSHGDCTRNPQLTSYQFAVADAEHRPLFYGAVHRFAAGRGCPASLS